RVAVATVTPRQGIARRSRCTISSPPDAPSHEMNAAIPGKAFRVLAAVAACNDGRDGAQAERRRKTRAGAAPLYEAANRPSRQRPRSHHEVGRTKRRTADASAPSVTFVERLRGALDLRGTTAER